MAKIDSMWEGIFIMCSLFDEIANIISKELKFSYDKAEAKNSLMFLRNAQRLDKYATDVL